MPKSKIICYDGLELACWGDHFEVNKADEAYCHKRKIYLLSTDLKYLQLRITWLVRLFVIALMKGTKVYYLTMYGAMEIRKVFVRGQRMK